MATDSDLPRADLVAAAAEIADRLLFAAAADVERTGRVPAGHFEALARAGLFGAVWSSDFPLVAEALASGCLTTTFVWMQHHGLVRRLGSVPHDRALDGWQEAFESGHRRAGIVQAGLLAGRPVLTATPVDGGWRLDGRSPWCTGWGMIDTVLLAARLHDDDEQVVWLAMDARDQPGLSVERLRLQAVDATATVALRFGGVFVPAERGLGVDPLAVVGHAAGRGLRPNGSLALGLARRCDRLLAGIPGAAGVGLDRRLDEVRSRLDGANDAELPAARAAACRLAIDAATALVAATGAGAAMAGSTAERLMREATFLLVFGSRPSIKAALLAEFGDHGS